MGKKFSLLHMSRLVLGAMQWWSIRVNCASPAEEMSITFMVVILHILAGKLIKTVYYLSPHRRNCWPVSSGLRWPFNNKSHDAVWAWEEEEVHDIQSYHSSQIRNFNADQLQLLPCFWYHQLYCEIIKTVKGLFTNPPKFSNHHSLKG
jgi:hypothetical protein